MKNVRVSGICTRQKLKELPMAIWSYFLRSPIASLLAAIIVGGIIIQLNGYSALETYSALLKGAFSDWNKIVTTMTQMTPVMFTALAYTIGYRAGLINLGMEGQLIGGALAAAIAGYFVPAQFAFLGPLPAIVAAMLAGGFIAAIPAVLKRWLNSNEMLISLMLNYVVDLFSIYMVNFVVKSSDNITPATSPVQPWAMLGKIVPNSQLSTGFLLAIVLTILLWLFLYKTSAGFKLRATGINKSAATFKGIQSNRVAMYAFIMSGMIAGIGGAVQVLGVHNYFIQGMSPGYGWDGLSAALLGSCEPFGGVLGSLVFGAMRSGSIYLSRTTSIPSDFIYVIEGTLMIFVATPALMRRLLKRNQAKKQELE
ncbi:MAG: ABC transporter permease [Clostridia bacterium]